MADLLPTDFWDQLVLQPENPPEAQNADDRVVLALEALFPDAASGTARARARSSVLAVTATFPAQAPMALPVRLPSSTGVQRHRPLERPAWRVAMLAAALLLILSGTGIALLSRAGMLPGWHDQRSSAVIPAVPDRSADVVMRGVDPGRTNVVDGPGILSAPEQVWVFDVTGLIRTSPVVAGGVIYVGISAWSPSDPGTVAALRTRDGSTIWTHPTDHGLNAAFLLDDDTLYVVDDDGVVYALDTLTGNERWRTSLGQTNPYRFRYFGAPVMAGGRLIVSTGSPLSVAASGNSIFVGHPAEEWTEGDQHVYALSPTDGSIVWDSSGFPAGSTGGLFALSAADGSLRWNHEGTPAYLGPSAANGMVFYGENSPTTMIALDATTGDVRWRTQLTPGEDWDGMYSASISGETIIAGLTSGESVTLDRATGTELWRIELFSAESPFASWMVSGLTIAGSVAVAEGSGALTAYSIPDQKIIWHLEVVTGFTTPPPLPIIVGSTLFQVEQRNDDDHGRLVAYRAPPATP
jgi:outer membrane protein assembly factor BamB